LLAKEREKKKKYTGLFIVAGCYFSINTPGLPAGKIGRVPMPCTKSLNPTTQVLFPDAGCPALSRKF
jgi:hypothetical protein